MDYRDDIIRKIADAECHRVSRKAILALQKMKEGMMSGDDTPLQSVWDEVCVQVQFQESFGWEVYLQTMSALIESEAS